MIPVTRCVSIDPRHDQELLAQIDAVLREGAPASPKTAALIALLHAARRLVAVVDRGRGIDKNAVKKQANALVAQRWQAQAAYEAIQRTRAAGA